MENNNSIESSLQKKIKQNDEKLRLLLNKGLYNDNNKSSKKNFLSPKENKDNITEENPKIKKFNTNNATLVVIRKKKNKSRNAISQEKNHKKKMEESKNIFSSFNDAIELFKLNMKERIHNLNKLKLEIEKNQKELYSYKSNTNRSNKKHNQAQIKETTLENHKTFIYKKQPKKELIKHNKKKEVKLQSAPTVKNKMNINDVIDNLEKWDKTRKEKINKMKKEQDEKLENEFDYIPKINEKSLKIVEKNGLRKKQPNIFIRLSQQDKILKEKKKLLIDMYKPSFKPYCYEPRNLNFKNVSKFNYFTEPNQLDNDKQYDSDDKRSKNMNEDSNNEEEEEKEDEEEIKSDDFDYQQDIFKYTDKNIEESLRNSLFHHRHNQKK